jgi:hypothetical protein
MILGYAVYGGIVSWSTILVYGESAATAMGLLDLAIVLGSMEGVHARELVTMARALKKATVAKVRTLLCE